MNRVYESLLSLVQLPSGSTLECEAVTDHENRAADIVHPHVSKDPKTMFHGYSDEVYDSTEIRQ